MKKFISQSDMRIANIFEVLSLIRKEKSITRKEIQSRMGLSWGGASQIVTRLIELSYITEKKVQEGSASGRTPCCLEINAVDNYIIGIDINLSGLYAVVANLNSEVIYNEEFSADTGSKESFLTSVYTLLDSLIKKYEKNNIMAIGVAMQGSVDLAEGLSIKLGIDGWENVPIADMLSARYNIPAYIAHDPDCILMSATSENKSDALLVRIDSGIGMALIRDESLISGAGMHEIGNSLIRCGSEVKRLRDVMLGKDFGKDEKAEALGLAISNSLIMYNVNKLFLCGNILEDEPFLEKLNAVLRKYVGDELSVHTFDSKMAALGAAIFATEEYLCYIK